MQKQPDNGSDRYAAKYKHRLGSEYTFKHTAEFFSVKLLSTPR